MNRTNLIVLALSIIMMLIGLEIATRMLYADVSTTGDHSSFFTERWYAHHPPRENRLGFRERDFPAEAPEGVYRIAVIGDSIAYGQGVLEPDRFSNRLQRALNEAGGRFDVLNFGDPGANYEEHTSHLELALREANPDFVLLQWYHNDIEDPDDRRPRPWRLASSLHRLINPHSALYYVANDGWSRLQKAFGLNEEVYTYYERYRDPASPAAAAARRRLLRLVGTVEDAGVPFALLLWPPLGGDQEVGFLLEAVLDLCWSNGWRCLDLRTAAGWDRPPEDFAVNRFDVHPNALAHQIAAEALLSEYGETWRSAGGDIGTARNTTGIETTNDVVERHFTRVQRSSRLIRQSLPEGPR